MATPDIFLSYNREDIAQAKLFAKALAAEGFEVWWDQTLRSGEAYDRVTEKALTEARAVVVLWSPRSVESRWVRAEATEAERSGKLVPAMIEACKRPIMFELTHTAELSHWKGSRKDPAWRAFVDDLRRHAQGDAPAAPVTATSEKPAERIAASRSKLIAAVLAAVLLLGGAVWAGIHYFGGDSVAGSRSEANVPVLVRAFAASGGGDSTEAGFASGITDELIVRLRRIPELRVATAQADGSAPSEAFAGAYVVDGTLRSTGQELRVTARLIGEDGEILWSQAFDGQLADLFEVQEQMAASIANALSVPLNVGTNSTEHGGTDDPQAYAAYMQYRAHWMDSDQSVPLGLLERAIALDPGFAKAQSELSIRYTRRISDAATTGQAEALLARMDDNSAQALAASPGLGMAHAARGWYEFSRKDYAAAERYMRRAEELDRNNAPELRTYLAIFERQLGRAKKAAAIQRSLATIDPVYRNDPWNLVDLILAGRHQETIALYERLARIEQPNLQGFAVYPFMSYLLLGRESDAIAFARNNGIGNSADTLGALRDDKMLPAMPIAELRQWAAGRSQIETLPWALYAGQLGNPELAVRLMRVTFEKPGGSNLMIIWLPPLEKARRTPEFAKLMTDLGLVKAWRESGDWGDFCKPANDGIDCV